MEVRGNGSERIFDNQALCGWRINLKAPTRNLTAALLSLVVRFAPNDPAPLVLHGLISN